MLVFTVTFSFSQEFSTLDTLDGNYRDENKAVFTGKINKLVTSFGSKYPSNVSRKLEEHLENFMEFFLNGIDKGTYIYNTPINEKIDEIYNEISKDNPNVPEDFQVLVSRDISLNASCFVNGTMVVNIGTIKYLESEDQLAAILCHEIGHKLLNHSEQYLVKSYEEENSKKTKKEIRDLKKNRYNQQELAFTVLKEKLYNNSEEKRKREFEADSIGLSLLGNTKYDPAHFLRALELSLLHDTIAPADLNVKIYSEVFDLPGQPFNQEWLVQEDFSTYDYVFEEKFSKDSLSSHPEINERVEKLKSLFPASLDIEEKDALANSENPQYQNLRLVAKKEEVPNLFLLKKYGFCIYLSLIKIEQDYRVAYHKEWMGKAFHELYKARKSYTANKYLDRINPEEHSESYQQFINFMWNLNLQEIKNIADFYSKVD
ncbi:hypothetical protein D2V93_01115 [Flagellimonas taeanensis]|nr:hypothetical protein D2V93_01115 [Allomuricauda taeanensis]